MGDNLSFPEDKTGPALFKKYMVERAIQPQTVIDCGIELTDIKTALNLINPTFNSPYRHCFVIPYLGHNYAVARVLGEPKPGFGEVVNHKSAKMIAPKGSPLLYIPPICDLGECDGTLYLCESALKAIVLSQHGFTAVAGNGVSGIYTNKGFVEGWPAEMLNAGLIERVVILFDADWQSNMQVQAAVQRLAGGIKQEHPRVEVIHKQLKTCDDLGEKYGIDDATYHRGVDWLKEWLESADDEQEVQVSELDNHLLELNEQYVVIRHPAMIYDTIFKQRVLQKDFTDVIEGHRMFKEAVQSGNKTRMVEVNPAKEWLRWDKRRAVSKMLYRPGEPEFSELPNGDTFYNSWQDTGCPTYPREADVKPFLDLYMNAIPDAQERELLIESIAWMIQNRTQRMNKCFALVGRDQGTGKSLFVETIGEIVGETNYRSINAESFGSKFNAALTNSEIILLDDVVSLQTNAKGMFKNFITGKTMMVENKGKDPYKAEITGVLFITSNEFDSIPLDAEDRRVHICGFNPRVQYPQGDAYWTDYIEWLGEPQNEDSGYARIKRWLLDLDLTDFNPQFLPPQTDTKKHMRLSRMDEVEMWVENLWAEPDQELLGNKRAYYTIDELAILYAGNAWGQMEEADRRSVLRKLSVHLPNRFSRCGTNAIRTEHGRKRYWGIRSNGIESLPADVQRDVKSHPTLKVE